MPYSFWCKKWPRHDPTLDPSQIDDIDNLLLLCRVHHKMVDDQCETYTGDKLREIKRSHEQWVNEKLEESASQDAVQIVRFKHEIPDRLMLIESGQELFNLLCGCHGSYLDHSDNLLDQEVEQVGGFLQNIKDWIDIGADLEPIEKIRAGKALSDEIQELKRNGFRVFCAREKQQLQGGAVKAPSSFYVLHLAVIREGDGNIVFLQES